MGIEDYGLQETSGPSMTGWPAFLSTGAEYQRNLMYELQAGYEAGVAIADRMFTEQFTQRDPIVAFLRANIPGVTAGRGQDYVDQWGFSFFQDNGRVPTIGDATIDPGFLYGGLKLPTWADMLPPVFIVNGPQGPVIYDNTTFAGPVPVPVDEANYPPQWRPTWDDPQQGAVGFEHAAPQIPEGIPVISAQELAAVQQFYQQWQPSGGGGGRATPVFDRRALEESIREQWRGILLEEPSEMSRLVDAYIAEATSFYLQSGTQTNLSAWLMEEVRQTPRYRLLYGRKPEGMSEQQYLSSYQGVAGQFGLRPASQLTQTVTGMSGGLNLDAFGEGIGQSREYMSGNEGPFSQAFAGTFRNLGVLMRS